MELTYNDQCIHQSIPTHLQTEYQKAKICGALDRALKFFGEYCRQVTLHQLEYQYKISINSSRPFSLSELESALSELFGSGSALVIRQMYSELEQLR